MKTIRNIRFNELMNIMRIGMRIFVIWTNQFVEKSHILCIEQIVDQYIFLSYFDLAVSEMCNGKTK